MSSAGSAGSEYSSTYSDSGSSYGYSSVSSAELPHQVARVRPRLFHQPVLASSVRGATPLHRLVLERPERPELSIFELCLGTVSVGAPLLLHTDASEWGALAACSRETQLCLLHHLHLDT